MDWITIEKDIAAEVAAIKAGNESRMFKTMSLLSERVTEAIEGSGIDVPDVASACKISVQAVYKWMNGKSKTISGAHLIELSEITGYEARWIIGGKGEKRQDQKALSVYMAMRHMPEYKKDMLVKASINHTSLVSICKPLMDDTIGKRIRHLRKAHKLSGGSFGRYCGVSKGMVSQWEKDDVIPPVNRLILLKEHIDFSIDYIYTGNI